MARQFEGWMQGKAARPRTGGLYKTKRVLPGGFVEASPSRALRDGEGTVPVASPLDGRANLTQMMQEVS